MQLHYNHQKEEEQIFRQEINGSKIQQKKPEICAVRRHDESGGGTGGVVGPLVLTIDP